MKVKSIVSKVNPCNNVKGCSFVCLFVCRFVPKDLANCETDRILLNWVALSLFWGRVPPPPERNHS